MKRDLGRATIRLHFAARAGRRIHCSMCSSQSRRKNSPSCSPSLRWMTCSPCR
jgi:hypothetical protein